MSAMSPTAGRQRPRPSRCQTMRAFSGEIRPRGEGGGISASEPGCRSRGRSPFETGTCRWGRWIHSQTLDDNLSDSSGTSCNRRRHIRRSADGARAASGGSSRYGRCRRTEPARARSSQAHRTRLRHKGDCPIDGGRQIGRDLPESCVGKARIHPQISSR